MSEKPVAALVTALAIAPLCALCILGPALVGSLFASVFGWLSGFGGFALAALAAVIALVTALLIRQKRRSGLHDAGLAGSNQSIYSNRK